MATFTNRASITYRGNTITSNTVTGQLLEDFSVTKTALYDQYTAGGVITYVISLINSGTDAVTGFTVSDNLGAPIIEKINEAPLTYIADSVKVFIDGVLDTGVVVDSESPLILSGITVPAGANALIVYETTANEFADPNIAGSIINTVTVDGGNLAQPITAQETVTAAEIPSLSVIKTLSPATVEPNGTITYTMTVYNYGNTAVTEADDVVMSDTFEPILQSITVTQDGTALPTDAYTYSETTGVFETTAGLITLPAATFVSDPVTGAWTTVPATTTLTITGTV